MSRDRGLDAPGGGVTDGRLELARGMSPAALADLAELETRTVSADGGRLKLEWGTLRTRSGGEVEDLLWWDGDRLVGFLGLYSFGSGAVELAGMVDPAFRRRGIASALLDAALPLCRDREKRLLVTPRTAGGGREFALARGAALDHSEFALALTGPPAPGRTDPLVVLRPATGADAAATARLRAAGFDSDPAEELARSNAELVWGSSESAGWPRTLVIERAGTLVGVVNLSLDGGVGGVYGFVVDPAWQGRGIGRDALRRFCELLLAAGAERVGLEVEARNDRALGLYTSLGFEPVTTEDYYRLP
jgi:ribosomal protein S18 acetylase RimI-like enzyme